MTRGRTVVEIKDVNDGHMITFGRFNRRHTKMKGTCVNVSKKALEMLFEELEERDYKATLKSESSGTM